MPCAQSYEVGAVAVEDKRIGADEDPANVCPVHRVERRRQLIIAPHGELLHFQPERACRRLEHISPSENQRRMEDCCVGRSRPRERADARLMSLAHRRIWRLCGRAFANVLPPDEPEKECDKLCGAASLKATEPESISRSRSRKKNALACFRPKLCAYWL